MSARFVTNFVGLLVGAGLLTVIFAFPGDTAGWVSVGAGGVAIVVALANFALPHQGVYQRCADAVMAAVGAWAIVAARVLTANPRWLEFGAGAALAALGAIGLVVRELELNRGLQVGDARIRADHLAQLAALQRDAGVPR
jgi:hypothetical protein